MYDVITREPIGIKIAVGTHTHTHTETLVLLVYMIFVVWKIPYQKFIDELMCSVQNAHINHELLSCTFSPHYGIIHYSSLCTMRFVRQHTDVSILLLFNSFGQMTFEKVLIMEVAIMGL